jgi:hypothetical protein
MSCSSTSAGKWTGWERVRSRHTVSCRLSRPKPGRRFVEAAKRLQDVLGEHQDSTVAKNRILVWAEQNPGAEAAADDLLERELRRRRKTRRDWPDAWDALRRRARAAHP